MLRMNCNKKFVFKKNSYDIIIRFIKAKEKPQIFDKKKCLVMLLTHFLRSLQLIVEANKYNQHYFKANLDNKQK